MVALLLPPPPLLLLLLLLLLLHSNPYGPCCFTTRFSRKHSIGDFSGTVAPTSAPLAPAEADDTDDGRSPDVKCLLFKLPATAFAVMPALLGRGGLNPFAVPADRENLDVPLPLPPPPLPAAFCLVRPVRRPPFGAGVPPRFSL